MEKQCSTCRELKLLSEFHKNSACKDGLMPSCKVCRKAVTRARYLKSKESIRTANEMWRKNNPDMVRAAGRRNAASYVAANRDKVLAQRRARYHANAESRKAEHALWKRQNKDYNSAKQAERKLIAKQAKPAWADDKAIREFYRRADHETLRTGVKMHVDHIVPLISKKVCGLHCEFNLQLLPASENVRKGNRTWPDMP